jgi:hypothetical protein
VFLDDLVQGVFEGTRQDLIAIADRDELVLVEVVGLIAGHRHLLYLAERCDNTKRRCDDWILRE